MGDLVFGLMQSVAFRISETSSDDNVRNWEVAERLVRSASATLGWGNDGIEDEILKYLADIPPSAMRRCDPSGLGYLAEKICLLN